MLTRCPQCRTVFKVSAGQIKARGGLVRCGRCHAAFDAVQMLIDVDQSIAPPAAADRERLPLRDGGEGGGRCSDHGVRDAPVAAGKVAPAGESFTAEKAPGALPPVPSVIDDGVTATRAAAAAQAVEVAPPASEAVGDAVPNASTEPLDAIDAPSGRREPVLEAAPQADTETAVMAEPAPVSPQAARVIVEELVQPPGSALEDFLQAPPPRRWPWVLGSAFALLALAMQAIIALRVELTVLHPPLKPVLVELCAAIGCEVGLPRQIDLISIESSALHPGKGNRLELVASVRNRAPFAQQYPHLEVTLTDAADRAVVRRAFAPREWLPAGLDSEAGFAAQSELAIDLMLQAKDIAPAGYRLYIFYP